MQERQASADEGRAAGNPGDFPAAVLDQDVGRILDMCETLGSNRPVEVGGGAAGGVSRERFSTFPLHVAAAHRRLQSMRTLLSAGADAELRDQLGRSPLHLALASWPDAAAVAAAGPKPDSKFHRAVISKCRQAEACLLLLCGGGVDVNAAMVSENTHQRALHVAACRGALPAVRILARYGGDVHAVDSNGMTPLHVAASLCHGDIVKCLIAHGADVNQVTRRSGNTPLHAAATAMTLKAPGRREDRRGVVAALLECGADPDKPDGAGLTPLQAACGAAAEELVDLLLEHGADVNRRSPAGESCLFLFLNRNTNVETKSSLLLKLLGLLAPLRLRSRDGRLPAALRDRRFSRQRDQLLRLAQQPKTLRDTCKTVIYLNYVQGKRTGLTKVLPRKLYDFVFNQWDNINDICFDTAKQEV